MQVTIFLLTLEIPGSPGGVVPSEALEIVGVGAEVGVGVGAETEEKKVAKRRMAKRRILMPAPETSTARKEATQGATVVVRPATKQCDAPDRCVAFAAVRAIRRKYAPTSSPSLPAKLTRVAATATGFLAEKSRMPSYAMHQASVSTSLVDRVQMRSHGRWGISRQFATHRGNDRRGKGCNKIVPVLGGNGTKKAPTGDISDQPPGGMS